MKSLIGIAVLTLLSACAPSLTQADAHGGIVTDLTNLQPEAALAVADAHCRQYGRKVRVTGSAGDALMFQCVE
jgi:hypothetical protein